MEIMWEFQLGAGIGVFFFLYFLGKGIGTYLLYKGEALREKSKNV